MVDNRVLGLLFHKVGEKNVFFIETLSGSFLYVIESGVELTAFMMGRLWLQQDHFHILTSEEAQICQIVLEKISLSEKLKD